MSNPSGWSGAASTRFLWNSPASGDAFSHTDFAQLIGDLDGAIPKGALGYGEAAHADISANNDASPIVAQCNVTVPAGTRNLYIVAHGAFITGFNSSGVMGVYLLRNTTTLQRDYISAKAVSSSSSRASDLVHAEFRTLSTVHVNPPTGAATYKLSVNVEGGGTSADGKVIQTDGAGTYQPYFKAWIAVFEL